MIIVSLFFILIIMVTGYRFWQRHTLLLTLGRNFEETQQFTGEQNTYAKNKAHEEQTEEKLRRFLELMDTLMNTIPNPIYFKDSEGLFQGCNKVFAARILGLTRDRIIGKRAQDLSQHIPCELAAIYEREERKMMDRDAFHTYEAQVLCSDGQRRDFLFSLAPVLDHFGKSSGSVAVLSDLTDKNRAAQNLMQKEKLEGVLETAGAVCHELNQPLQTISGYTELVAMALEDHEIQPNIQKIMVQIDRMRDITDKLQGITRYETTDYSKETKIIDIEKASGKKE